MIHDRQGNVVHKISITPVAADKPPFPLPKFVNIPVYFTIQPGGSIVGPEGAELVYPNWAAQPPGVKTDFWDYNPSGGGWWVYGQGTVSADGRQVVPDPDVEIYRFSGAMINAGISPPPTGPAPDGNEEDTTEGWRPTG